MKHKIMRVSTVPLSLDKLLNGQLRMLAQHYDVVAVSSPGAELDEVGRREGVRTEAVPMERRLAPFKDLVSLCKLIRLIRKEKPQLVHSLTPKAGLLTMLAAWICRVPVRIHTFTGLVFPTSTGLTRRLLMTTDRITCACATYVNPEGEGVKNDLLKHGITRKPLHIIGNGNINGVDLSYYDRTPEVMTAALPYRGENRFTFCFVGRMVRDKGVEELVLAFTRLRQVYPKIRLLLVGPFEDQLDPVSERTRKNILTDEGITFLGWQDDIRPFLAASDVFVFPSYREGFPNVVLQAGALGLPCIVTNINGCNEIIRDGQNGVIIEPRSVEQLYRAMQRMVEHPLEVERMAIRAREWISRRYSREALWNDLLRVYQSLLPDS